MATHTVKTTTACGHRVRPGGWCDTCETQVERSYSCWCGAETWPCPVDLAEIDREVTYLLGKVTSFPTLGVIHTTHSAADEFCRRYLRGKRGGVVQGHRVTISAGGALLRVG